jgi:UDP-N-acetylglucosamine 2-epimerase (non-hydrolysing)
MKPLVMTVFGTRPEAVKMAPLVLALRAHAHEFDTALTVTAQHREMLDQVLDLFGLTPDHDLNLMKAGQALVDITSRVLAELTPVLAERRPALILVHGDTTTTFAASLAAFYQQIPVGHVEAGLRTPDRYNPYPEEMNRRLTTQLTNLHFAPTATAVANLLKDGVAAEAIYQTGNTVIDALLMTAKKLPAASAGGRKILVTAHRRENWGEPMGAICRAIKRLADHNPDVQVIFPIHRNPIVRETANAILGGHPRIEMIEPLDYAPFVAAMRDATLILTDSGGVQEEAPSLGKPVLVMRTTTERPEAIDAGTVELVGVDEEKIFATAQRLLDDQAAYDRMAKAVNPYGDGRACGRIVEAIRYFLGIRAARPDDVFDPLEHSGR